MPDSPPPAEGPVRTCLGCRQRDDQRHLLRVAVAGDPGGAAGLVVDPRRRAPGRGAYVHPDRACVAAAVKRRAFGRALRTTLDAVSAGAVVTTYLSASPEEHPGAGDGALGRRGSTG